MEINFYLPNDQVSGDFNFGEILEKNQLDFIVKMVYLNLILLGSCLDYL